MCTWYQVPLDQTASMRFTLCGLKAIVLVQGCLLQWVLRLDHLSQFDWPLPLPLEGAQCTAVECDTSAGVLLGTSAGAVWHLPVSRPLLLYDASLHSADASVDHAAWLRPCAPHQPLCVVLQMGGYLETTQNAYFKNSMSSRSVECCAGVSYACSQPGACAVLPA